jgi:hypothetical protein
MSVPASILRRADPTPSGLRLPLLKIGSKPARPAAAAARRAFALSAVLGGLGLAFIVFVVTKLVEAWRLTTPAASHEVSILGQRMTYPVANVGAIIVSVLALAGLLMAATAVLSLARELVADRRFRRALAGCSNRAFAGAWVIEDDRPQAFCAGLWRPRVYISTGALRLLDGEAAMAVLAHERHHARRRDPLRLACGRALAAGLFAIPALRGLVRRQDELAEMSADEAAVLAGGGDGGALASAMLEFAEADGGGSGIAPERVDHLLGERVQWRFPVALCLGAAAVLSLFISLAALAAQGAVGSATLAPPFLSSQPCVVVLAMIPAVAGLARLAYANGWRQPLAGVAAGSGR